MTLIHRLFVISFLTVLAMMPVPAFAQWGPDGVVVCDDPYAQQGPIVVEDEAGGAFILWRDSRPSTPDALYLQHLTASGALFPGWPANGKPIITAHFLNWLSMIPDEQGGVLVGFADTRSAFDAFTGVDAYCIRILSDGSVAPGWIASGTPVCTAIGDQFGPNIVSDGSGGVLAVWPDERNGTGNTAIYGQHLSADGVIAPGWNLDGVVIDDSPNNGPFEKYHSIPVADGAGGMIVFWVDTRSYGATQADIYAQRISGAGEFFDSWTGGGNAICTLPGIQDVQSAISDGAGGAYVAWVDAGTGSVFEYDLYASRIRGNSHVAVGWPANGLLVCDASDTQQDPRLTSDGSGGMIVAWEDYRSLGDIDIYATRVLGSGVFGNGWAPNGNAVAAVPEFQFAPRIAGDGDGGAFVLWQDYRDIYTSQYIVRIGSDGAPAVGWPTAGRLVAAGPPGPRYEGYLASDGSGGAFAAWNRAEGSGDICAQHFPYDSPVAVLPSLVDAEASPGIARLTWFVGSSLDPGALVERSDADEAFFTIGPAKEDGAGHVSFEDRTVVAGRYAYRLRYREAGIEGVTDPTWLDVPLGPSLSLVGFIPNPGRGSLPVSFTLESAGSARLELFTIGGRRVAAREVGTLGPGSHIVPLDPGEEVRAGVYWLRLTQGGKLTTRKGIVVGS